MTFRSRAGSRLLNLNSLHFPLCPLSVSYLSLTLSAAEMHPWVYLVRVAWLLSLNPGSFLAQPTMQEPDRVSLSTFLYKMWVLM